MQPAGEEQMWHRSSAPGALPGHPGGQKAAACSPALSAQPRGGAGTEHHPAQRCWVGKPAPGSPPAAEKNIKINSEQTLPQSQRGGCVCLRLWQCQRHLQLPSWPRGSRRQHTSLLTKALGALSSLPDALRAEGREQPPRRELGHKVWPRCFPALLLLPANRIWLVRPDIIN